LVSTTDHLGPSFTVAQVVVVIEQILEKTAIPPPVAHG
jgi:hypothetical protein